MFSSSYCSLFLGVLVSFATTRRCEARGEPLVEPQHVQHVAIDLFHPNNRHASVNTSSSSSSGRVLTAVESESAVGSVWPKRLEMHLEGFGRDFTLDLLLNQNVFAAGVETETDHSCYYAGKVRNEPESIVALSVCGGEVAGMVQSEDGEVYIVGPATGSGSGSGSGDHLMWRISDVPADHPARLAHCDSDVSPPDDQLVPALRSEEPRTEPETESRRLSSEFEYTPFTLELYLTLTMSFCKANEEWGGNEGQPKCKGGIAFAGHLINMVNAYYQLLKPRIYKNIVIVISGIDEWSAGNQAPLANYDDPTLISRGGADYMRNILATYCSGDGASLSSLSASVKYGNKGDAYHVLTSTDMSGMTAGIAYVDAICVTNYNCGINEDLFHEFYTASTIAHELGHNLGALHDSVGNDCHKSGYIMAALSTTTDGEGMTWSKCSELYINNMLQALEKRPGNGNCLSNHDLRNMTIAAGTQCNFGDCCDMENGDFKPAGSNCRDVVGECDRVDQCDGKQAVCPMDTFQQDYTKCPDEGGVHGHCYSGTCVSYASQCKTAFSQMTFADSNAGEWEPCEVDEAGYPAGDHPCKDLRCKLVGEGNECMSVVVMEGFNRRVDAHTACGPEKECDGISQCVQLGTAASCAKELAGCSGHGSCAQTIIMAATCYCDPGWTGNDCSEQVTMECADLHREVGRIDGICGSCLPRFASTSDSVVNDKCVLRSPEFDVVPQAQMSLSVDYAFDADPTTAWEENIGGIQQSQPVIHAAAKDGAIAPDFYALISSSDATQSDPRNWTLFGRLTAAAAAAAAVEGGVDEEWVVLDRKENILFGNRLERQMFRIHHHVFTDAPTGGDEEGGAVPPLYNEFKLVVHAIRDSDSTTMQLGELYIFSVVDDSVELPSWIPPVIAIIACVLSTAIGLTCWLNSKVQDRGRRIIKVVSMRDLSQRRSSQRSRGAPHPLARPRGLHQGGEIAVQ